MGILYSITPTGTTSKHFVLTFSNVGYLETTIPHQQVAEEPRVETSGIVFIYVSIELCYERVQTTIKFRVDNDNDSKEKFNRALKKWKQLDPQDFKYSSYYAKTIKIFSDEGFTRTFE